MASGNGTDDGASAALSPPAARRKFWGWGLEGEGLAAGEIEQLGAILAERFGIGGVRVQEPPRVDELDLRAPRRRRWRRRRSLRRHSARILVTGPPTRTAGRSAIWSVLFPPGLRACA
jgi:hypothetical protein